MNVTAPEFVCNDAAAVLLTTDDLYNGDWTDLRGCLSANGQLTPSDALPGIVSITYSSDNPCAQTTTVEVEIGSVPNAIDNQSFCEGTGEVVMVPVTNGGSWTAACANCCTSDGVFDTQSAGTGAWDLTYTIDGNCPATGTATFTVTQYERICLNSGYCFDHDPLWLCLKSQKWTASCTTCISR